MGGALCGEGPQRGDTPVRVLVATAGVALRLCRAPGRLALELLEFEVDRAQTPLTGHVLPPAHHEGAPPAGGPPLATGRMLQVSEPSMDGVRHCGSPSPRSGPHGGGPLPDLPGTRLPRSGPKEPAARAAAPRPAGVARSRGRLARPPWRGPAAPRRVTASLSRKIVRYVQEMLHAWAREIRERWCAETRRRRQRRWVTAAGPPVLAGAISPGDPAHEETYRNATHLVPTQQSVGSFTVLGRQP
jgi:hypothetical protein